MNILYCGDKNIKEGLYISIISLIKHVEEPLNIYVFTVNTKLCEKEIEGLKTEDIEKIDKKVKEKNGESFVKLIDITRIFEENLPLININTRFTACCMLRLYADEVENLPDKILYLDNDVICRKNPREFYYKDIDKLEIVRSFRLLWKMVF